MSTFSRTSKSLSATTSRWVSVALVVFLAALAFIIGVGGALFGWFGQLFLLTLAIPVGLLAINYRFGMFALVLLMPFAGAQYIPKLGPLSIINLLLLGVLSLVGLRYILHRIMGRQIELPIPREFVLYYLLPVTFGYLIGSGHLNEIAPQFLEDEDKVNSLRYYWISTYLKGVLFAVCGVVLAAVVVEYNNARRIVLTAVASSILFILVSTILFLLSSQSLEAAVFGRRMFSSMGRHANGVGAMLLPILGATLFMSTAPERAWLRYSLVAASLILVAGVFLTGSRGAFLGLMVVVCAYVWKERRLLNLLAVVFFGTVGLLFAPSAITDRLTMGLENLSADRGAVVSEEEQLTSGRLFLAKQLLPEIMQSPLIGHGVESTRWSDYAKNGGAIGHPHNIYLRTLMDLGILGLICMALFVWYAFRLFSYLCRNQSVDPLLRKYFLGSAIGLMGYLTFGLSGGNASPTIEQWFLWVALGVGIGCKRQIEIKFQGMNAAEAEFDNESRGKNIKPRAKGFWSYP